MSFDTKKITKNAYRITKDREITALRIRVPGGHIKTEYFELIKEIADEYGNGTVHLTTRQGFEVPGIPFEKIDEVNRKIEPILEGMEKNIGVEIEDSKEGYPAAGTRNVSACIGNRVCRCANYDTTRLAQKIEKNIFPNDYHVKIALSGCPNDCIKGHLQDFGILGMVEPIYQQKRCIGCQACVNNCNQRVTGALSYQQERVKRDEDRCIGCGECILQCPTNAWERGNKYYKVVIMGRTGKKNPRLAKPFLKWATEEVVVQIVTNVYDYIEKYIDDSLAKEHVGYIVDRTGYPMFKEKILTGVELNSECQVAKHIQFGGYQNDKNISFVKIGE
ncbi:sulfite reductase subunit C [Sporohalobacter salinus]|uniref:sulfite reductase subunit C n=1 Tax=Sporohalobacter salinus TaxID=1494606 RepID=UPI001961364A|nr:sulfite reductase subunit C [Sporohalobacter salinus]MBM7624720.1 anaerobic sulfite reductase subunit C [Sporohalobacter salinus]